MPGGWKTANVVPVHTKKKTSSVKNYRPISLLPIASNFMENIVNKQLCNFLGRHQILSQHQFGFRTRLGTSDLLAALQFECTRALGRGGCVRVLAIDIAGAFDKVSHRGLLSKAEALGISGELLQWVRSYLSDRKLQAVVGGHTSPPQGIDAGVLQGSILGPILFLLYVNDLEDHVLPGVELAVYADDTTIYTI